ncbi:hypothetical protein [Anaerobacillus sp. 1_MG-2023]|uniref:hypothetical protein n=1 Tax=Bacillales TaxID=1385 RepID=UPI0026E17E28|nr:hypothetical protein [Anaerobacillus sp. 1_MG-2023]MDO6657980.1 hypothetical protein [Anaerobacillus sp. 1_MG-2023]
MKNWSGLLRKEFRLSRTLLLGVTAFDLLVMIGFFLASARWEVPYLTAIIGAVLTAMHVFFLPLYLLISLNTEGRNLHLWLHNPQSGARLLGAKLLNGLLALLLSIGIISSLSLLAYNLEPSLIQLPIDNVWLFGFYFLTVIITGSVYMGIWLIFYWTLYQVLKTYIGKWALLLILLIVGFISWFGSWLSGTRLYEVMIEWGYVELPSPLNMEVSQQAFELTVSTFPFAIGNVIFDFITIVLVFMMTCWLLDRKVEV